MDYVGAVATEAVIDYVGAVAIEATTCGLCRKVLIPSSKPTELTYKGYYNLPTEPTVGVLSCSHVYHADCLEQITTSIDKFDPKCPLCNNFCL